MSSPETIQSAQTAVPTPAEEMAECGITLLPIDYFHYREFRYTNLMDALAQAKRDRRAA